MNKTYQPSPFIYHRTYFVLSSLPSYNSFRHIPIQLSEGTTWLWATSCVHRKTRTRRLASTAHRATPHNGTSVEPLKRLRVCLIGNWKTDERNAQINNFYFKISSPFFERKEKKNVWGKINTSSRSTHGLTHYKSKGYWKWDTGLDKCYNSKQIMCCLRESLGARRHM